MTKYTVEEAVPYDVNRGLTGPTSGLMKVMLGVPSPTPTVNCSPLKNKKLAPRMITANVGPFNVTGFDLAVRSLKEVITEIRAKYPDMKLSCAGMLCCRLVRGTKVGSISNHSWGTAIDLKIDGVLDERGDHKVQHGLHLIAPIFNKHGWYWGAHFSTEDGMHFEISVEKLKQWKAAGLLAGLP
ncbi:D-alanyl-D-alanine carboxypeptidase [uncultured Caudovirales phage]|uniref:D-alanyl-D-alanine carboxypeptidase n=1 Tax=uncultured Caudovirales phage TaxID=2100421 RepID=A0A6J7WC92_9CAUD|nr:D-alanyl-D-alanine carboxypeptidase [uncultured Caudovirales phage]